jgi:hypothetical protein
MNIFRSLVAAVFLGSALVLATCLSAFADEWQAVKLRGSVFVFVDDAWAQLERGDLVPDNRVIRTAPKSRVQFMRGEETIDLGPDTQIRIFDRVGQEFTIVQEHFGEVAVEVERRNVQHFAIQTQFLVAVVKGTRFTVNADVNGAKVSVLRGQVEVRDVARKLTVDVTPGQHASVGEAESLTISGPGTLAPIVAYAGDPLAAEVATVAEGVTVTTTGTPATNNVIGTPAASVVAKTPAATKTTVTTTTIDIVTPAVANTVDTPAADVVANTPAATNSPPAHSNAGGKNK